MDSGELLLSQRLAALADVDNAKFSWFHVKICAVTGVGFFTDAYDIISIGIAAAMLGYLHGEPCNGPPSCIKQLNTNQDLALKIATPVGNVVGQLLFGWLADAYGRKKIYGIELYIILLSTFAQAFSGKIGAASIITVLTACRFLMGIAIGGDYPVSAIISSEFAPRKIRGRMMGAVFACQGWGSLFSAALSFILVNAYKRKLCLDDSSDEIVRSSIDYMWRLLIGLGTVPGCVALYFRFTIPETPRFTLDIEGNIAKATRDIKTHINNNTTVVDNNEDSIIQRIPMPRAGWEDFGFYFAKLENFKAVFGTTYSWFAVDVAFYSLLLNTPIILEATNFSFSDSTCITESSGHTAIYKLLRNTSIANLIISGAALITGSYLSLFFIDSWGRKRIQLASFTILALLFMVMGFDYKNLLSNHVALSFLYCLAFFFFNFGPNTTTFIIPGEIFPTRYRSTAYGICAAGGKLGAIVAQVGFSRIQLDANNLNPESSATFAVQRLLQLNAFFMISGFFSTLLVKETKSRSLEYLSNEEGDKES